MQRAASRWVKDNDRQARKRAAEMVSCAVRESLMACLTKLLPSGWTHYRVKQETLTPIPDYSLNGGKTNWKQYCWCTQSTQRQVWLVDCHGKRERERMGMRTTVLKECAQDPANPEGIPKWELQHNTKHKLWKNPVQSWKDFWYSSQ